MCINFQTSTAAFTIGELFGLKLALNPNPDKKKLGLFIMFFSLVQIFEALIYKGYDQSTGGLISKLLLLNLAFQGLVFFLLFDHKEYSILTGAITLLIVATMIFNFNPATITTNNCLKWNFININNGYLLNLMYFFIFYFGISSSNNFYNNSAKIFAVTLIISFIINKNSYSKTPSFWCLTSALAAPIFNLI